MEPERSLPHSPVPILSQIKSVHASSSYFLRSILVLSSHPFLGVASGLLPSGLPTKLYMHLSCPPNVPRDPSISFFYSMARIIAGEKYKLWSSSSCSLLHSHVTASLLGPNILLSTLFSNTLGLYSSLIVRDQVSHTHKNNVQNYSSVYLVLNSLQS